MRFSTRHWDRVSLVDYYPDPVKALSAEQLLVEKFRNPSVNYHIAWWSTTQSLIAPRSLKHVCQIEEAISQSSSRGWPVFFRHTGGDVTPQGPGILNVALAFALDPTEQASISGVYQLFCAPIVQCLQAHGCEAQTGFVPGSFCDGEYNIIVNNRKIGGTAQRWTRIRAVESRQIVFVHALLLFNTDIDTGVCAINQLYEDCGLERKVQSHRHINLVNVLDNPVPDWQEAFACRLHRKFTQELKGLTA